MRRCWASSEALPRAPLNRETASVPVEVTTQIYFMANMKAQCRDPCADERKRDLKPAFRDAFKERRFIIPADGFYEWKKLDAKAKQPYAIVMKDRSVFGFAGLWERWKDRASGQAIQSCTIITTAPNEVCAPIHDRMSAILDPKDYARWLGEEPTEPAAPHDDAQALSRDRHGGIPREHARREREEHGRCPIRAPGGQCRADLSMPLGCIMDIALAGRDLRAGPTNVRLLHLNRRVADIA
jgi:hypothetical protein